MYNCRKSTTEHFGNGEGMNRPTGLLFETDVFNIAFNPNDIQQKNDDLL